MIQTRKVNCFNGGGNGEVRYNITVRYTQHAHMAYAITMTLHMRLGGGVNEHIERFQGIQTASLPYCANKYRNR